MPHTQSSHVSDCFEVDNNNKTYKCTEKKEKKNGEECGSVITEGMRNERSNLKRHLQRFHAEKSKRIKQAEDLKSKQEKLKRESNQTSTASHFRPQSVNVPMNKKNFI